MCSCHCWFSLVCITRTRRPASTRPGPSAPVFTSGLRDQQFGCEHTGPLRHVTGFPDLRLLRVLRPIPPASAGNGPSRRSAECRPVREPAGWFPRSLPNRSTGSAPNYAPATSPRLRRRHSPWLPSRRHQPTKESPHTSSCVGVRCYVAPIRQVRAAGYLEKLSVAGSSRTPFCLACRTRTIWRYWSVPSLSGLLSTLTPVPEVQAALSFTCPLRRARGGVLPPPHG